MRASRKQLIVTVSRLSLGTVISPDRINRRRAFFSSRDRVLTGAQSAVCLGSGGLVDPVAVPDSLICDQNHPLPAYL
jgi:hypothetical protein